MSLVGEFPGLNVTHRRTIRAPINPLDKSTIVSIYPKAIIENKPTITPGSFRIEAGSFTQPTILVVGPSSWWREIDEDQPLLEIPVSSIQIADSFVKDYCNGLLGCNLVDRMPGVFFLPGEHTIDKIKKENGALLLKYQQYQKNYWLELVRIADIMYARTNGNPLSISDDARLACDQLNIKDKEWLKNFQNAELTRCVACGSLRNPSFPICPTCKAVADPELAKKLNIQFAQ